MSERFSKQISTLNHSSVGSCSKALQAVNDLVKGNAGELGLRPLIRFIRRMENHDGPFIAPPGDYLIVPLVALECQGPISKMNAPVSAVIRTLAKNLDQNMVVIDSNVHDALMTALYGVEEVTRPPRLSNRAKQSTP